MLTHCMFWYIDLFCKQWYLHAVTLQISIKYNVFWDSSSTSPSSLLSFSSPIHGWRGIGIVTGSAQGNCCQLHSAKFDRYEQVLHAVSSCFDRFWEHLIDCYNSCIVLAMRLHSFKSFLRDKCVQSHEARHLKINLVNHFVPLFIASWVAVVVTTISV